MTDPHTLPELFVRLTPRPDEGVFVTDEPPALSAEAVALALFEELMEGYGEPEIGIVFTTRGRDATEECTALFERMREVNGGLFDFGFEYRAFETLEHNAERLRYIRDNDYPPRKPVLPKLLGRRGFY